MNAQDERVAFRFLHDVVRGKHKDKDDERAHGGHILEKIDEHGAAVRGEAVERPRSGEPQAIPEREAINRRMKRGDGGVAGALSEPCACRPSGVRGRGRAYARSCARRSSALAASMPRRRRPWRFAAQPRMPTPARKRTRKGRGKAVTKDRSSGSMSIVVPSFQCRGSIE
jgi:hypothetical protein